MKRIPILVDKKYSGHWFDQKKAIRFDSNLSGMDSLSDFHEAMYLTKSNTWIWNEFTFGNDGDVDSDKYFKSDENFASKWLTRHRVDIQNYEEVPQTVKDSIESLKNTDVIDLPTILETDNTTQEVQELKDWQ